MNKFLMILVLIALGSSIITTLVTVRNEQYYSKQASVSTEAVLENMTGQVLNTTTWESSPVQVQAGKLMIMYFKTGDQLPHYIACTVLEVERGPRARVAVKVRFDTATAWALRGVPTASLYNGDVSFFDMDSGKVTPQFFGYVLQ